MARRPTRRRIQEYALAAFLSLVIVWLIYLIWNIAQKEEVARHAARDTKVELATLTKRETTLRSDVALLSSDRGKEAALRQTFGVAKPGEEVIIVVPQATTTPPPPESWWQKSLDWVQFWKH